MVNKRKLLGLLLPALLMISLVVGVPVAHTDDPPGYWAYTSERVVYYYVTASGGDAYLLLDQYFEDDANYNPFFTYGASTIGGLVFQISDRVSNDTHYERVEQYDAWLDVYSDSDYSWLPGALSVYPIEEAVIGAFQNYTDLLNRPVGNSLTIPMDDFVLPGGGEGYRGGGSESRTFNSVFDTLADPSLDNDTIALKLLSTEGGAQFLYETYDSNASRAPRLRVEWSLYTWVAGDPPTGYEDDDYLEDYRGFNLWWAQTSGWVDFSRFTVSGANSGKISLRNATYFKATGIRSDDDLEMYAPFIDDGSGIVNRKFGITYGNMFASGAPTQASHPIWAITDTVGSAKADWNDAYALNIRIYDLTPEEWEFIAMTYEAGGWSDKEAVSDRYNDSIVPITFWYNMTVNMNNANYTVDTYNDYGMTSLNVSWNNLLETDNPGYIVNKYPYEQMLSGYEDVIVTNFGYSADFHSITDADGVKITDIDGNDLSDLYDTIEEFYDTVEEAKDAIDRLLAGVDPSYDALPNLGNTIIVLMGMMGLLMIPGSFIVCGMQIRAGDWTSGFYYLIMLFVLGLGFVTVWLFG